MDEAGYKSTEMFISAARVRNSELGYVVDEQLRVWLKGAERAVVRDKGPTRKASVVDPETIAGRMGKHMSQEAIKSGPVEASRSLITACWFMLREIELLSLTIASVIIHHALLKAELRLGSSKTDIEGKGVSRFFSCTCKGSKRLSPLLCPYHVLKETAEAREGANPSDPLFVSASGKKCTAQATINVWRKMLADIGVESMDDMGETCDTPITGHTPRRSGAQWLTRLGLVLWQVCYIGRWGSSAVEGYVAQAAASRSANFSLQVCDSVPKQMPAVKDKPDDTAWWEVKNELSKLQKSCIDVKTLREELSTSANNLREEWRTTMLKLDDTELLAIADEVKPMVTDKIHSNYVVNRDTGKVHRVAQGSQSIHPSAWRTHCGWKFGMSNFDWVAGPPPVTCRCTKNNLCFVKEIDHAQQQIAAQKSESSDDE